MMIRKLITRIAIPNDPEKDYIERNGYHFTEELADYVSEQYISPKLFTSKNIGIQENELPENTTLGDLVYLSNHLFQYFNIFGIPKTTECPKFAITLLTIEYPEMSFKHFLEDVKAKGFEINWKEF